MRYLVLLILLLLPTYSHAAIIFSEIAWMGTPENANDEWIELYNHDSGSVNVDGWRISDGVSLDIPLTGTIPGRAFVLLERTDDDTVPSVNTFQIYTGALANDGRTLTLTRADGTVEDRVVGGENWVNIGGDNTTKKTAQGTMTGWVTGTPTPGAENVAHDDEENEEEPDDNDTTTGNGTVVSKRDGGSSIRISMTESNNELNLGFSSPDVVYVHQPVTFKSSVSGIGANIMNSLVYRWNFGDTYAGSGKEGMHTYVYPGEYVVVLNASYARHDVTVRKVIKVLPVDLTLSRTLRGDIVLTNNAGHDIDLSGYVMKGTESFTFPEDTYVLKEGVLTVPKSRVVSGGLGMVALYDTEKTMVASEMGAVGARTANLALATPQASGPASYTTPRAQSVSNATKPASIETSDMKGVEEGEVAGTSTTVFAPLTIPVYASGGTLETEQKQKSNILPYTGLIAVIVVAIVLLYRRPTSPSEHI
jgi:Lamin Tail Domain/PKD domain